MSRKEGARNGGEQAFADRLVDNAIGLFLFATVVLYLFGKTTNLLLQWTELRPEEALVFSSSAHTHALWVVLFIAGVLLLGTLFGFSVSRRTLSPLSALDHWLSSADVDPRDRPSRP